MDTALTPPPLFTPADLQNWAALPGVSAFDRLQGLLAAAVAVGRLPGAVVWAEHRPSRRSQQWVIGQRAVLPSAEAMTLDTVFDAASLTKGVVTATLMAQLLDEGRLEVDQPVAELWPWDDSARQRVDEDPLQGVTVRHLMTHSSGLAACLPLSPAWSGPAMGQSMARSARPTDAPGTLFRYSDINFILAQGLIERISGASLATLARGRVFEPCGMAHSHFLPLSRGVDPKDIAPTECDGTGEAGEPGPWLRGTVHDPVCRRMGGVGGHAGLFTTAGDLARYARMLLRGGVSDEGVPVMSPGAIAHMTAPASPPGLPLRSLGWDIDSPYARARGRVHGPRSFGHTAFTGCALWIDPDAQCFTVLLSNRVHTAPTQSIVDLYEAAATLGARAVRACDP